MPITQHYKNFTGLILAAVLFLAAETSALGSQIDAKKQTDDALFRHYPVPDVYHGPVHMPDFKGRDRSFSGYRTRIRDGLSDGANFAGHYAVTFWGCGTECVEYVVGDVTTGKVFNIPFGGEEYPEFRLHVRPNSRFAIATWVAYNKEFLDSPPGADVPVIRTCFRQNFLWNGSSLVALSKPLALANNKDTPDLGPDCDEP